MAKIVLSELDEYSRIAVPFILARFPEWKPFASPTPRPDGLGATVNFNVPCPSPHVESGLWVSTDDEELSVGFHTHHSHFTDYDDRTNFRQIEAGLEQAAAYLEDRSGVVSWYEGDRMVGSTSADLPLDGPLPRIFSDDFGSRGTLRSWSGKFDRDG